MRFAAVILSCLFISSSLFISPGYPQSPPDDKVKNTPDVRDQQTRALEEEIIVINLLNNLDLTKGQLEFIIRQERIQRYLLSRKSIPVLENRLRRMR
jgi:hypothetical protein